jgi:hypothetical protein
MRIPSINETAATTWECGDSARPLLRVEANDGCDYVEGRQLFLELVRIVYLIVHFYSLLCFYTLVTN